MTAFLLGALALGLLTAAYVFRPLAGRRGALGIAMGVAALASTAGLYLLVGTPAALDPARREPPRTLDAAIQRLEQALRRDPKQAEGWRLLADAYRNTGRVREAADAFARAAELQPRDPDLLAQAAEARALASPQRRFDAQAMAYLRRALEMDPSHQRATWFLGVAQRQAGEPARAAATWERLLDRVDAGTAAALRAQIDAARAEGGLPALPDVPPAAASRVLRVDVDIDAPLRDRLPPSTPVFVIAREPGGPPMPVAVKRLTLAQLPARVELADSDGVMPTRRLSQVARVEVLARASASGGANAASGDLESAPSPASPGEPLRLRIDRVRP